MPDSEAARTYGTLWIAEARTAMLLVPSVVARLDSNILVNPNHPDADRIKPSPELTVLWDDRLFR